MSPELSQRMPAQSNAAGFGGNLDQIVARPGGLTSLFEEARIFSRLEGQA